MESLLLLRDAMRICQESSDMAILDILWFGGDDGRNKGGMGSIGVDVFSIVLIGRVDKNKNCFEDTYYNKPIYNSPIAAPASALESMQPLSALDVLVRHLNLKILL